MALWQAVLLLLSAFNLFLFFIAHKQCRQNNSYGLTKYLFFLGMYVWGDVLIFSLFWTFVSVFTVVLGNFYLFLTFVSYFWTVRSLGETIYWFNQQYSTITKEPPHRTPIFSLVKNDSVWFIQQIINQCLTVISLVASVYFTTLWLQTI